MVSAAKIDDDLGASADLITEVELRRRKRYNRYYDKFGIELESILDPIGRKWHIIKYIREGTAARRFVPKILRHDIVVGVNGVKVVDIPTKTVNKMIQFSGESVRLQIITQSVFRMIAQKNYNAIFRMMESCLPYRIVLRPQKKLTCLYSTYGFWAYDICLKDPKDDSDLWIPVVRQVKRTGLDIVKGGDNGRGVCVGDIILEVEGVSTVNINQEGKFRRLMHNIRPQIRFVVLPCAAIRLPIDELLDDFLRTKTGAGDAVRLAKKEQSLAILAAEREKRRRMRHDAAGDGDDTISKNSESKSEKTRSRSKRPMPSKKTKRRKARPIAVSADMVKRLTNATNELKSQAIVTRETRD